MLVGGNLFSSFSFSFFFCSNFFIKFSVEPQMDA